MIVRLPQQMDVSDAPAGESSGLRGSQILLRVLLGCHGKVVQVEMRGKTRRGCKCVRNAGRSAQMQGARTPRLDSVSGDRQPQTRQRAIGNAAYRKIVPRVWRCLASSSASSRW